MKKSELSFKCVVPNNNALKKLKNAVLNSAIGDMEVLHNPHLIFHELGMFFCIDGCNAVGISNDPQHFNNWPDPLVSYEDALKLIESIEPEAPEFDIKPFDRILARGANGSEWLARLYESKGICSFMEIGGCFCNQLIKYDGNEHLHRTANPAAGWWECENGKPVWKTK